MEFRVEATFKLQLTLKTILGTSTMLRTCEMVKIIRHSHIHFVILFCCLVGCQDDGFPVQSPEFYSKKLNDQDFRWEGPVSHEDRIPSSHAARALAYIGDDAVPFLFDAVEREDVDIISVYDALSEIGLPVQEFHTEIVERRDPGSLKKWWEKNKASTRTERSNHRIRIGLPPIKE
jgi:hypothetical protein